MNAPQPPPDETRDYDSPRQPMTPRLFYWEDAHDCWCPVPFEHEEVPGILSVEQFDDEDEEITIRFKRFDMNDLMMGALPKI